MNSFVSRPILFSGVVGAALLLVACQSDSDSNDSPAETQVQAPTATPTPTPNVAPAADTEKPAVLREAPAEYFACEEATDCVAIEMGACDHCNGGSLVAARAEHVDEIQRRWANQSEQAECTEMACAKPRVECVDSTCRATEVPGAGSQ